MEKIKGYENRPQAIKDAERKIQETAEEFLKEIERLRSSIDKEEA